MRKKWHLVVGSLALCGLMLSGCAVILLSAGAAAGIGAYKYVEGTMEKDYPRDMQATYQACMSAATTLGLRVAQQQYGQTESRLEAVQPPDTTVKIQLGPASSDHHRQGALRHDGQRRPIGVFS